MESGGSPIELPLLSAQEVSDLIINNNNYPFDTSLSTHNILGFYNTQEISDSNNNNNNVNNILGNEVEEIPRGEKRKVEDGKRIAAACLLCRARKRKCDGLIPCSYCSTKNVACQYIKQKKRGPPKRLLDIPANEQSNTSPPSTPGLATQTQAHATQTQAQKTQRTQATQENALTQLFYARAPLRNECKMLDQVEAQLYATLYLKYVNVILPVTDINKIMTPVTPAQRVQSYAALAYASRICGDSVRSNSYINQARLTASEVFDTPSGDAIGGLMMMSNFWQLVVERDLSVHYARLAHSLTRMVPNKQAIDFRFFMATYVGAALCEESSNTTKANKLFKLAGDLAKLKNTNTHFAAFAPIYSSFCNVSASLLNFLNYNAVIITPETDLSKFFDAFDDLSLTEEARVTILHELNNLSMGAMSLQTTVIRELLDVLLSVLTPMYMVIVEWRSGHPIEAVTYGLSCLRGLDNLEATDVFLFAGGLVDLPHLTMMAGVAQLMFIQGHFNVAAQFCDKIKLICKIMDPDFNFIRKFVDEFLEKIPDEFKTKKTANIFPFPKLSSNPATNHITNSFTIENFNNGFNNEHNAGFNNLILNNKATISEITTTNNNYNNTNNNNNNNNSNNTSRNNINNVNNSDFDTFCDDLFSGIGSHTQ